MALDVGTVQAKITADTSGFKKSMKQVEKRGADAASKIRSKFKNVGETMRNVGTRMTAGLTLPIAGAAAAAIKASADFETLKTSMNVLNGSVEEGARNFERLKEFSAGTPFQLGDLAEAQNMLQGFGLSADDAFESLKMIGDIAAVSGGSIQGIGIAFGQAAAEGQLMTRDIRQLVNQGVPALKLLADSMGVARDQIFDLASQGQISFQDLQESFKKATEAGGMFADGTKRQAETLAGLFSTLKDNVRIALAGLGDEIAETFDLRGLARSLTSQVQNILASFEALSSSTKTAILTIAGLLGAGGPILVALGFLTSALAAISWPVVLGVGAFAAATTAIISKWDTVSEYFSSGSGAEIFSNIKELVSGLQGFLSGMWDTIGEDIENGIIASFELLGETVSSVLGGMVKVMKKFNGDFNSELNIFEDNVLTTLQKLDSKIVEAFSGTLSWLASSAKKVFLDPYLDLLDDAAGATQEFNGVLKAGNAVTDSVSGYLDSLSVGYGVLATNASKAADAVKEANTSSMGGGQSIPAPTVMFSGVVKQEAEKTKLELQGLSNTINSLNFDVGNKIFPPGSLGALQGKLAALREQLLYATDPAAIQRLKNQISLTREEMNKFSNSAVEAGNRSAMAMGSLGNAIGGVIGKLIKGQEEALSFGNILASVAPALINILTGGTGGFVSSIASGLFGGIFHGGGIVGGSGDVPIMAQAGEGVFTKGQMKAMGLMVNRPRGQAMSTGSMEQAFSSALSQHTSKLGPNEVYVLSQKGKRGY